MEVIFFVLLALVAGGAGVFYFIKGVIAAFKGEATVKGFFKWLLLEIVLSCTALFCTFMAVFTGIAALF